MFPKTHLWDLYFRNGYAATFKNRWQWGKRNAVKGHLSVFIISCEYKTSLHCNLFTKIVSHQRTRHPFSFCIHQVWFFTGWPAFCPAVEPSLMCKHYRHKHTGANNRLELLQLAPCIDKMLLSCQIQAALQRRYNITCLASLAVVSLCQVLAGQRRQVTSSASLQGLSLHQNFYQASCTGRCATLPAFFQHEYAHFLLSKSATFALRASSTPAQAATEAFCRF